MTRKVIQLTLKYLSIAILAKYRPKVVAITGSVGKTSAKETIFLVLEHKFPGRVRRGEANLNTEIGVPLAVIGREAAARNVWLWLKNFALALKLILRWDKNYPEILVLEMAADRPGDISYLTSFIHPDIAVVTAIGEMPVHLEFFPERDTYISEKAALIKNLKPGGLAVLNYDDLAVRELRDRVPTDRRRIYYGFQTGADIRVINFDYTVPASTMELERSGMNFKVEDLVSGDLFDFRLPGVLGLPSIYAALAAAAVGRSLGLDLASMAAALEKFKPPAHRLELVRGIKETIILDDTYNSSPAAADAALEVLAKFKKNRRIAVLGSMRELGVNTETAHRRAGKEAAPAAQVLFLVGDEMVFAREEAEKFKKKSGENLFWFKTSLEAAKAVEKFLQPGDVVLIKGSRSVKMEAIVEEIKL